MSLTIPLVGGTVTQRFGPSIMAVQPPMYHIGTHKAYWQPFDHAAFNENCHAGVDFAGKIAGTPLVAAEAGTVVRSTYDGVNGGGHVVEVEIRPNVRYSYNHCNSRLVTVGQRVAKGQKVATVGATGTIQLADGTRVRSAFGVHCHTVLTIREKDAAGTLRTMLYDFGDFMAGGSHAADGRVKPTTTTTTATYPLVTIRPNVNMRSTPDLDVGATNIVYSTRADGVYDRLGRKVAKLSGWQKRGNVSNDDGAWGKLYGLGRYVYVMNGLYY